MGACGACGTLWMFKKFLSNALLSVVMEKSAREKLQRLRDAKEAARAAQEAAPEPPGKPPAPAPRGKKAKKPAAARRPPGNDFDPEQRALELARVISEMADGMAPGPPPPSQPPPGRPAAAGPAMTSRRQQIIDEALAVQRSKRHLYDALSNEEKLKLLLMAKKAMGQLE